VVGVAATEEATGFGEICGLFLCASAGEAINSAEAVTTDAVISAALFLIFMSSTFVLA